MHACNSVCHVPGVITHLSIPHVVCVQVSANICEKLNIGPFLGTKKDLGSIFLYHISINAYYPLCYAPRVTIHMSLDAICKLLEANFRDKSECEPRSKLMALVT